MVEVSDHARRRAQQRRAMGRDEVYVAAAMAWSHGLEADQLKDSATQAWLRGRERRSPGRRVKLYDGVAYVFSGT